MTIRSTARRLALAAAALALAAPGLALRQAKLKVAAVYTVPFEQQWVGRLHKALKPPRRAARSNTRRARTFPTPTTSG
jgi:hypothetical protein